ncbi:MAG: LysR family transcriptional regulator [Bdellovibrionales bacterium]|nr:LysR family transcriptional regulator [Bdellovibrionales bacterium]
MEWQHLKTFFVVGETQSMSLAARELKTTQATVSRHIQSLEQELKHTLVKRDLTGSHLTPIGLKIHEQVRKMHYAAYNIDQELRNHKHTRHHIIVSCGEMTSVLLSKNLAQLKQGIEDVEIIITSTNTFLDLAAGEADVVIRNRMHDLEGFVYHPLEQAHLERYSIYGNAATFKKRGRLKSKQLSTYDWVVFSKTKVQLQTEWLKKYIPNSAIKFKVHHAALVMDILSTTPNTLAILPRFVGESMEGAIEVYTPKEDLSFRRYIVRRNEANPYAEKITKNILKIFMNAK